MRNRLLAAIALALLIPAAQAAPEAAGKADHSKFEALQQKFASGPDVTLACLTCHTEASRQVHKTEHWKWEYINPDSGQKLGKRHIVNNFCTSKIGRASCRERV